MKKVNHNSKAKQVGKVKQIVKQSSRSVGKSVKASKCSYKSGAGEEIQTLDVLLGKYDLI